MSKAGRALVHFRAKCIGCGACADEAPEAWSLSDADGLADVAGGVAGRDGVVRRRVGPEEEDAHRAAAAACPVDIIQLG